MSHKKLDEHQIVGWLVNEMEHKWNTKIREISRSKLAEHSLDEGHRI
jgi:hypothetical protein